MERERHKSNFTIKDDSRLFQRENTQLNDVRALGFVNKEEEETITP